MIQNYILIQHEGDATIQVRGVEMYDGFSIDFGINYQDGTMDSFMVNMLAASHLVVQ